MYYIYTCRKYNNNAKEILWDLLHNPNFTKVSRNALDKGIIIPGDVQCANIRLAITICMKLWQFAILPKTRIGALVAK